jgi:hypothetical protein
VEEETLGKAAGLEVSTTGTLMLKMRLDVETVPLKLAVTTAVVSLIVKDVVEGDTSGTVALKLGVLTGAVEVSTVTLIGTEELVDAKELLEVISKMLVSTVAFITSGSVLGAANDVVLVEVVTGVLLTTEIEVLTAVAEVEVLDSEKVWTGVLCVTKIVLSVVVGAEVIGPVLNVIVVGV